MGFSGGTSGKEPTCLCRRLKRCSFSPWVGKILWRREWQPTPVFLPGVSHGQRSLAGLQSIRFQESDTIELTQHAYMREDNVLSGLIQISLTYVYSSQVMYITVNCGKFLNRLEYQTTFLPPEKRVCRSRSNSYNQT